MLSTAPTKKELLELLYTQTELAIMAQAKTWRNASPDTIRRAAFQAQRELMHNHAEATRDDARLIFLAMAQALDTLPTTHVD